jgi:hypothetical protein
MVLTMVHNTQNYWVFGLFPSSDVLGTRRFGNWICFRPQVKVGEKTMEKVQKPSNSVNFIFVYAMHEHLDQLVV